MRTAAWHCRHSELIRIIISPVSVSHQTSQRDQSERTLVSSSNLRLLFIEQQDLYVHITWQNVKAFKGECRMKPQKNRRSVEQGQKDAERL
jgi:hypothetical protein